MAIDVSILKMTNEAALVESTSRVDDPVVTRGKLSFARRIVRHLAASLYFLRIERITLSTLDSRINQVKHPRHRGRYRPSTYAIALKTILRPNSLLHFLARVLPGGFSIRPFLHRLRGVAVGDDVWIGDDVYIDEEHPEAVEIREGASIATRCTLIAHTKGVGKIIIGERAAVGAGCIIVCACGQTLTIGEGAAVSAGSTVSSDIPAFALCGPPRIQIFGKVGTPFHTATTIEEFRRGVWKATIEEFRREKTSQA